MITSDDTNRLLFEDPGELLVMFSGIISEIVHYRLIQKSWYKESEREDLEQEVSKRLLEKLPVIRSQFKGISSLKTYLIRVIINICNELCREAKKSITENCVSIDDIHYLHDWDRDERSRADFFLIDKEAMVILKRILTTFPVSQPKLILFLKILYRCPIQKKDIGEYCKRDETDDLLILLNDRKGERTKTRSYEIMTELVTKYEGRNNTPDAVRKWLDNHIKTIVILLNRSFITNSFDELTLQYLFEKLCISSSKIEV